MMALLVASIALVVTVLAVRMVRVRCPWPQPWWVGPCVVLAVVMALALIGGCIWWMQQDDPTELWLGRGALRPTTVRMAGRSRSSMPASSRSSRTWVDVRAAARLCGFSQATCTRASLVGVPP